MQRMLGYVVIGISIYLLSCSPASIEKTYVEKVITNQGAVIEIDGTRFEIPAHSVADSILIRVGKHVSARRIRVQDFTLLGDSYVIQPETLAFEKPIKIVISAENRNVMLGVLMNSGFVPLVNSEIKDEILTAQLWHGGEYVMIETPAEYGIIEHTRAKEGLLIVSDVYVGNYVEELKSVLRQRGYGFPVWTFRYDHRQSVEDNARFLHEELKRLHSEYGEFRMDVVSFGVGGLVTHRYLTDSTYYQKDISSAVVAIGTPFFGSSFADINQALEAKSPFRFFFIDGMGANALALVPGSDFISLIQEAKHLPGFHYYDDPTENKNFVSLRGQKRIQGNFAEEISGDGLVSVRSSTLTPIEPAVFELDHFELLEDAYVNEVAADFVMLYREYSWPRLFSAVWKGQEVYAKVNDTWEREVKLHLRDDTDFHVLLEFNENMLHSAPQNAILITNGDYDTYPAWYLQARGVRQDVIIVNRSLLNLKDYARYLIRMGLPLTISNEEMEKIQHKKDADGLVTISDQLLRILLKQDTRPVVFSTTVFRPEQYGYPLRLSGLVYQIGEPDIDIVGSRRLLFEEFKFDRLLSRPIDSVDINLQNMIVNYAAIAFRLAAAFEGSGEYQQAIEALRFARRFAEEPASYYNEAKIHLKMGQDEVADNMVDTLLRVKVGDVKLIKEVARMYYESGMKEKAISILAASLANNPANRELADLITKYQED